MHWQNFMFRLLQTNSARFAIIALGTFLFFLTLNNGAGAQTTPQTPAEGSCNPQTRTIYGPNGTDSGVPCPGSTLSNDGIFGCMGLGAQVQNVGTRTAVGGIYVPVNDAAVTLNTGFLVYKECILDGVARKIAENAASEMGRQGLTAFIRGRGGGPQYPVNIQEDLKRQENIIVVNALQGPYQNALCPAFKNAVIGNYARQFVRTQNSPISMATCSIPTDTSNYWATLGAFRERQNYPYGAYQILETQLDATLANNERNQRERWAWSRGVYDTLDTIDDPLNARVITPGFIIAESIAQMSGSGFRQLENANEIDQVVGNLFGGLTTQLISDTRGLEGLTQSVNGQPSYLDRMTAQTSANVRQQATNAALSIISAARQIEVNYRTAKEAIATGLSNAIEQLRSAERQCWALIIPAVQTYASGQGVTTLNIATSTQFSQQIIDSQIAPLATTTINQIRASDTTIAALNELISSVSNSASQANQQQALLRLDTLVANGQLRTAQDATNAAQQRDSVLGALDTLVKDTVKAWGDSTDPNIGWCNVNNTAVVERWFNAWR